MILKPKHSPMALRSSMERALLFPTPLWREIKSKRLFDVRVININEGEAAVERPFSTFSRESAMQRRAAGQ